MVDVVIRASVEEPSWGRANGFVEGLGLDTNLELGEEEGNWVYGGWVREEIEVLEGDERPHFSNPLNFGLGARKWGFLFDECEGQVIWKW